jgi:hypothetical protein
MNSAAAAAVRTVRAALRRTCRKAKRTRAARLRALR